MSYIVWDVLKRILIVNGYKVKHVMNITDVGHLTGDRDMGEDKLEKGAKRERKRSPRPGKTEAEKRIEEIRAEVEKVLERLGQIEVEA